MSDKRRKLTDREIAEIRASKVGSVVLSRVYRVTPKHIWAIRKGINHKSG